jgi:hypothetical protein
VKKWPSPCLRTVVKVAAALLLVTATGQQALALDWISLTPNPAYSRDLAMGASTVALSYAPQSQSINPAGFTLYAPAAGLHGSLLLNGGGFYQAGRYLREGNRRTGRETQDVARMVFSGAAVQSSVITLAALSAQPVMHVGETSRYKHFETSTPLSEHQNSVLAVLALHPQVSVGGRFDRYYHWDTAEGDAYSYGVILRPRNVNIGVQYQRFPASGARVWHPLDRRADAATTAGIALEKPGFIWTVQVMNLTRSDGPAFLEPHTGFEWRPLPDLALRAGGVEYSRSRRWAWTGGIGLLDANTIRSRAHQLAAPDDVLQFAVGVIYLRRTPELAMGSLTAAWRF